MRTLRRIARIAEPLEPRIAPATILVTNGANSGAGSLRDAIVFANNNPGTDTITFDLDDNEIILPTSALPTITSPVFIDGYSDPGSAENTATSSETYTGKVTVSISGNSAPAGVDGLTVSGGGVYIRGIAIFGFTANAGSGGHGIVFANVASNDSNQVAGCWIGLTPIGLPNGNDGAGIRILAGSNNNIIGGSAPGLANVIVDNGIGIEIASDSNAIRGNYIGSPGAGNSSHGIVIQGFSNNDIGGLGAGDQNVIVGNGGAGVRIASGSQNEIIGNLIHSNAGLGIDLGAVGVTLNDANDADAGANNLQNFPVLNTAFAGTAATRITTSFVTVPGSSVRLEFFSSAAKDPSNHGEGQRFLGAITTASDATGQVNATAVLDIVDTLGRFVTATATVGGNTSEFSLAVPLTNPSANLAVAANGKSATYMDADGDTVTVKVSRGVLSADRFTFAGSGFTAEGGQLTRLDLSNSIFAGATVTFTAKRGVTGDGFANIGTIDATGVTLARVVVPGDLNQIFAGAGSSTSPGLGALFAHSLAQFTDAQPQSVIEGKVGLVSIRTHIDNAKFIVLGSLKTLQVGGSVSGDISITDRLRAVTIGGDLRGDAGSTTLRAGIDLGTIKILGDVDGARILATGMLTPASAAQAVAIKSVSVRGDIIDSRILAGHTLAGGINADAQIGFVKVGGNWTRSDLAAGAIPGGDLQFGNGSDLAIAGGGSVASRIASITIGGQVTGTSGGTDSFGFVAQQIGAFRLGKTAFLLNKTGKDEVLVGPTNDTRIREIV